MEQEELLSLAPAIPSTQVLARVNALIKLDEQYQELYDKMEEEIIAIQKKYELQYQPLYQKRANIVCGEVEPTGAEIEPKEPYEVEGLTSGTEKGIPEFWFNALSNHPLFGQAITEIDEPVFKTITHITATEVSDVKHTVTFTFAPNEFFTNTEIVVTLSVDEETSSLESIDVTPVQWKEGKNFTVRTVKKTAKKGGRAKGAQPVTKTVVEKVPCCFSALFSKYDLEQEPEEEEDMGGLQFQYQALISLKDTILPRAIEWYLGRGVDEENEGDFDEDMDMDFDDEEEEDVPPQKPRKAAPGGNELPKPGQPECKQQ